MIRSFGCLLPHEPPHSLILGSLPSVASLTQQRYYGHPQNAFWPIMEALFGLDSGQTPLDYAARLQLLQSSGIALWDVIAAAEREGSLDSAIVPSTVVVNDIAGLITTYPTIRRIFLNGGMAHTLFKRHIAKTLPPELTIIPLPSTSPANARMTFDEKRSRWAAVKA